MPAGPIYISIHALLAESDRGHVPMWYDRVMISIHALLAESDAKTQQHLLCQSLFLSTLSLRRATARCSIHSKQFRISIHALLAESDGLDDSDMYDFANISIHALLAESDQSSGQKSGLPDPISIHALLAESDGAGAGAGAGAADFYPRSPCGERRRAAVVVQIAGRYFYPRSPCGERQQNATKNRFFL